jgi:hypothetical protein
MLSHYAPCFLPTDAKLLAKYYVDTRLLKMSPCTSLHVPLGGVCWPKAWEKPETQPKKVQW